MTCVVRRATRADAAGLARVQVESWRSTYRGIVPDSFLAAMDEATQTERWKSQWADVAACIFVATDSEAPHSVVGFSCGGRIRVPVAGYEGELYAIYLLRERQRQGSGRQLMMAVAEQLREAGQGSMLAWVLEGNPSLGFYERLGAVPVARKTIDIGGVDLPEIAMGWTGWEGLLG